MRPTSRRSDAEAVGCEVAREYHLLGCLLDSNLTYKPLLLEVLGRSRSQFQHLYHAAESGGFSVPILAAHVAVRIDPGIAYVAPLLAVAPRMKHALDGLQAEWARNILGCQDERLIPWAALRGQCG